MDVPATGPCLAAADHELVPWLALQHLGPRAAKRLLARYGDAAAACAVSPEELAKTLGARRRAVTIDPDSLRGECERLRRWLAGADDRHVLVSTDPRYPPLLRELPDPPVMLYVWGDPCVLSAAQLAVVGSRNPTPTGRRHAAAFARALTEAGLTVTSGLAVGIDAAAHLGALDAGGVTVAVAATGLDRVYPPRHRELARRIRGRGALVSELPLGSVARREHFPRRNRIISGLSMGTLVVEATVRSGSLITARLAAEQGREVFALPGPILSPLSSGCHALIREGAKLVERIEDILVELAPLAACVQQQPPLARAPSAAQPQPDGSRESAELLGSLGFEPATLDELVARSGLTPGTVSSMLLKMELCGLVEVCPDGKYVRVR